MPISCIEVTICKFREQNTDAEKTPRFSAQEADFKGVKTSQVFMLQEKCCYFS